MAEIVVKLVNGELAGKTGQTIAKEYNAAALALKKAEVGTKEWVAASEKLERVKQMQADYKTQIDATNKASGALKSTFGGILNQIPGFSQLSGALSQARGGVGGLTSGFGLLKGAIAATGIGVLLIVLGGLFSWLSKIEDVTNVVKGAWDGLTSAFNVFIKAVASWDFSNLGDKMAEAAKEGYNLVGAFDELEDKARELDLSNDETGKTIDQLLLKSKNVELSYAQRLAILDQVSKMESDQHKKRLSYANEYLAVVQREVDNAVRQGQMNDDLADKLVAAKKGVIAAERETLVLQEKISNRVSALMEKQQAEAERAAAAAKKANDEKLKAELEALKESLAAEDNLRKLANEKKLLEIADAETREKEKLEQSTTEKILALQGTELQIFEQTKILREIQGIELNAITKKFEDQRELEHKKHLDKMHADSEKWAEEQIKIEQQRADFEKAIHDVEESNFKAGAHLIADLMAKELENTKAAKIVKKAAAIADIGISLAKERAYNAVAAAQYAATFPPPAGVIAGAAYLLKANIASAIRAGISIARIIAFKKGGIPSGVLKGPSHGQGGIPLVAEGDEIIMTKGVYQNAALRNAASAINVAGGGISFGNGGVPVPSSPYASSGSRSGGSSQSSLLPTMDPTLANKMDILISIVSEWPTVLQVVNNLQDTDKGLKLLNQLRADADL